MKTRTFAWRHTHIYMKTYAHLMKTYEHLHEDIHLHEDVRTFTWRRTYIYMKTYVRLHEDVRTFTRRHTHIYTKTHVHLHEDTYIYTKTCAHLHEDIRTFTWRRSTFTYAHLHEDIRTFTTTDRPAFLRIKTFFRKNIVQKIKIHILFSITCLRKTYRLWDYCPARQTTDGKYGTCALHVGHLRLQTHTQNA